MKNRYAMRTGVYCEISENKWSKISDEIHVTVYQELERVLVLFVVLFGTYFNVTVCTEGKFVVPL